MAEQSTLQAQGIETGQFVTAAYLANRVLLSADAVAVTGGYTFAAADVADGHVSHNTAAAAAVAA